MTQFDKCMSAWLLCCAAGFNFAGVASWLDGYPPLAIVFLLLSVAFIAAGSYRMFFQRKVNR